MVIATRHCVRFGSLVNENMVVGFRGNECVDHNVGKRWMGRPAEARVFRRKKAVGYRRVGYDFKDIAGILYVLTKRAIEKK